jgi:hypothetical protein
VKSQSLHENDQALYDQDEYVADYCPKHSQGNEERELEFEVGNV